MEYTDDFVFAATTPNTTRPVDGRTNIWAGLAPRHMIRQIIPAQGNDCSIRLSLAYGLVLVSFFVVAVVSLMESVQCQGRQTAMFSLRIKNGNKIAINGLRFMFLLDTGVCLCFSPLVHKVLSEQKSFRFTAIRFGAVSTAKGILFA